ncbi:MAG TPA: pitrilysin family protein [Candidatus Acidoferrum sp.]|nr:pitrilysin family protein [Candidatus Acidoferrum sp.]
MKPGSPARSFPLPPVSSALLRNGLKLHAVPLSELPLVSIHLVVPCGAEADPEELAGLADLSAEMLTLGTRKRSSSRLAAEIDGIGAVLSASGGWNVTSLYLSGLSEDLERLLELLLEIHTEPAFAPEEFEQLKQRRIGQLIQQKDESAIIADEWFQQRLFRGTPYDHPTYGTLESLPKITVENAKEFYRQRLGAPGSFLVLVGDLSVDRCFRWAEENFPGLTPTKPEVREFSPSRAPGMQTRIIDRPELTQSQIRLGHIGIPFAHPGYIPFEVMNYILGGGGFSSRLMQKIRSERGFTYGIHSSLEPRKYPGPFTISTFTPTDVTFSCVQEIRSVIQSFLDQGATAQEREEAVNFFTGSYPRRFETLSQIGQRIVQVELHGMGMEYLSSYPERVAGVSLEEISRSAREHIHPQDLLTVVVGRAENFRRSFESLGPMEVSQ